MLEIKSELNTRKMTQVEAATLFGVSQPRVSDLLCGRLDRFTLDTLINWLRKLGKRVDLVVLDKGTNHFQGGNYAN
jgi:predicted XRE-type DNA-binding protein